MENAWYTRGKLRLNPDNAKPSVREGTESGESFDKMAELLKDEPMVSSAFLAVFF